MENRFPKGVLAALALALAGGAAHAQSIVRDGSIGPAASTLAGPNYVIPASLGRQVGSNLFHSFSRFDLPGGSATFQGPAGIGNVVSRVTGGSASTINGTLACDIAGANLWLVNPSGVVFGANAQLNVSGTFVASTADYLKFGSTTLATGTTSTENLSLAVGNPTAFGFLGAPAPITAVGSGLVAPSIALVGGNVSISNTPSAKHIHAGTGGIAIASVAGAGELAWKGSFVGDPALQVPGGTVTIDHAILATDSAAAAPGPISIRAGKLVIRGSKTGDMFLSTVNARATGTGGTIDIGLTEDFSMTGGVVRSSARSNGNAGDIILRAANVTLDGGAVIDSSAIDQAFTAGGRGGHTTISATGDVTIDGGSGLTSITFKGTPGNSGGDVRVSGRAIRLLNGGNINVSTYADAAGGNVLLDADSVELSGGGRILAGSEFDTRVIPGSGPGGRIAVNSGSVSISGAGSGLFTETTSLGRGGTIDVNAATIRIADGGKISSRSFDPFNIDDPGGSRIGDAGSISLRASDSVVLSNGGSISTEATKRGGGQITLQAGNSVVLTNSSITTSVAEGAGNGGDITIDPVFVVLDGSQIIAQAFRGNGGNINIATQFLIQSPDSIIDASSTFGLSGTVQISSPNSDVGSRVAALPASYADAAARLRESCASRAGQANTFVGVGRGGLPASPDSAAYASYGIQPMAPAAALALAHLGTCGG